MEIRELKENELAQLLRLYQQLHERDDEVAESKIEDTWKVITNSESFYCLGAFEGAELISSCCLVVVPNLTRGCRPYGVIENVVTEMRFRNKGYGKKLLSSSLKLAWSLNCYKVMLLTGRLNEKTFQFYESAGFNRTAKQGFVAKPENT